MHCEKCNGLHISQTDCPFYNTEVSDSAELAGCEAKLAEAESRLLNAFQLVKNGKQIGYLKFEEFLTLLDKKHDHEGNIAS